MNKYILYLILKSSKDVNIKDAKIASLKFKTVPPLQYTSLIKRNKIEN